MPYVNENNSGKLWNTKDGIKYTGRAFPPDKESDVLYLTIYAEEQVLSSLLCHTVSEQMLGLNIIEPVKRILTPEHFSDWRLNKANCGWRSRIFEAMVNVEHIDIPHILEWLVLNNLFQKGMDDYLQKCIADYCLSPLDAEHYAEVVRDYYIKRMTKYYSEHGEYDKIAGLMSGVKGRKIVDMGDN